MAASVPQGVKVVVTGGRRFMDVTAIFRALDKFHQEYTIIRLAHGNASGADKIAGDWAIDRGVLSVRYKVSPDEWNCYGPEAGKLRNERMLATEQPDFVIAFPGATGTADCCERARKKLIPIHRPIQQGSRR